MIIPQLIRELYDGKEWAACRELAIAYLRHELRVMRYSCS